LFVSPIIKFAGSALLRPDLAGISEKVWIICLERTEIFNIQSPTVSRGSTGRVRCIEIRRQYAYRCSPGISRGAHQTFHL